MENAGILSEKSVRDDRVLYATRCLSIIIVPILLVSVGALYLFPDHTRELFAWTIKPRMSPMLLGGAYFFVRAATAARWHWVKAGFLPIMTFATMTGIATIVHWDRFNHSHDYPNVLIKPFAMSAKLTDIAWNYSSSYFAGHTRATSRTCDTVSL